MGGREVVFVKYVSMGDRELFEEYFSILLKLGRTCRHCSFKS